ncbi:MAG TPA: hypothetical protein VFJ57_01205 [Solirubrobacterales bacterium]|nr:hypothetical protein [Solirubrobacterales bacterium]
MPTKRRRHAVTETPPVQAALDELRAELGEERIQLGELVILGANVKLAALRSRRDDRAARLQSLARRVRNREMPGIDLGAAREVRTKGWVREWEPSS